MPIVDIFTNKVAHQCGNNSGCWISCLLVLRSYFPPERTKRILSHKRTFIGNILAALLGIVTPFCSCSAVPLFIGFVEAGVPLGITFSFLIFSPMVNEVAVVLLWGLFGWKIAIISFQLLSPRVLLSASSSSKSGSRSMFTRSDLLCAAVNDVKLTFKDRLAYARSNTAEIVQKVWLYVIIAIGIGGFIHGYVPEDFLLSYAGPQNPFGVPIAEALGVPLYSNAAGVIPIVYALMEKGMSMGTVLAFMMAVTALSLPEMIILRKVLKIKLLAVFVAIMTVTIIGIGYLFNSIL